MTDLTMQAQGLIDENYKDASPIKTVENIRSILASHNIEIEETWWETNVPHCFSLSVRVKGTAFSTHGKGLTKEFTLASAYGELMERTQLGFIDNAETQKNGQFSADDGIGKPVAPEVLLQDRRWYEQMAQLHQQATGTKFTPEQILNQYIDENGNIPALPMYNLTRGCHTYFPKDIRKAVYGSNGCAAGNTIEEAVVQAISEIVERYYKIQILSREIPVPEIPDEALQQFKTAYQIISYLRENNLQVTVKDCSLGTKFPVICVCYIDKKTGRYHTHFGASPVLEIALERALTESFQGVSLSRFINIDSFVYQSSDIMSAKNLNREMIYGVAKKTPAFFIEKPQGCWNSQMGFQGKNNQELIVELIEFFEQQGFEILVQDGSCLGFPTCRVLIPGCSEVMIHRLDQRNYEFRYAQHARNAFRNPAEANLDDYFGLLLHLEEMRNVPKGHDKGLFAAHARLSAVLEPDENTYLQAASLGYIYYAMGRLADALTSVKQMIVTAKDTELEPLICMRRYFELVNYNYEPEKIRQLLTYFHQPQTVQALYNSIESGNPFDAYVLHCTKNCTEECRLYGKCGQLEADRIQSLVAEKTGQLDFEAFADKLKDYIRR